MGKRQRRRLREQGDRRPRQEQQDTTPAVTVTAGLATAESSVTPGPDDEEQGP